MLYERCHTKNRKRSLKKYSNFWIKDQLDHPVRPSVRPISGPDQSQSIRRQSSQQNSLGDGGPKSQTMAYGEVHLDLTSEIEVFHMLFERCYTKIERDLSNSRANTFSLV